MLGIPMLGMVGAKTAIAKKIDKNARKKMQDAAPAVLKALGGMPRLKDEDRPADDMPISRLNRFNYGSPTPRKKAPENFKAAIKEAAEDPENKGAQTLAPTLRFCGGMSKAYKRK
jgi:hypothetical protein